MPTNKWTAWLSEKPLTSLRHWRARRRLACRYGAELKPDQLFTRIYQEAAWGASPSERFYSGTGSDDVNASRYVEFVNEFLSSRSVRSIVDLGCGDFRVGRKLDLQGRSYVGCDVVPQVIEANADRFSAPNIRFAVLDATREPLPSGDLLLIRQVLQHLTNKQIQLILPKIRSFRFCLITDELPNNADHASNLDVVPGGTRFERGSGLYLERSPFDVKAATVLSYPNHRGDRLLRTILVEGDSESEVRA